MIFDQLYDRINKSLDGRFKLKDYIQICLEAEDVLNRKIADL